MTVLGRYYKQPGETVDYDLDYTDALRTGETVVSASVVVSCMSTPADSAFTASLTVTSTAIRIRGSAGTVGKVYKADITATTSTGQVWQDEAYFTVRAV